jgi:mono/diheme cytochrome c family protein
MMDLENARRRDYLMKKATILFIALALMMPFAAFAEDGAALFKGKCAMCHGADGKKNAKKDLSGAEVQKMTVDEIKGFILTGEKHGFEKKGFTPEQAKAVAEFVKTLK